MHRILPAALLACALLLPAPAPAAARGRIYLAVERGQVLFLVDRNRWEPAPNYLRLKPGDALKVMPGTVGKIAWEDGPEYHLPVAETVTIEEEGISQRRDGAKLTTRFRDGVYETEAAVDDGREFPAVATPRAIELVPSEASDEVRRNAADEEGDRLRARLALAGSTVLEEDRDRPASRFAPPPRYKDEPRAGEPRAARIEEAALVVERARRASVDGADRHKAWRQVDIARRSITRLSAEIRALEAAAAAKEAAGASAADERRRLDLLSTETRDRMERLRRLEFRDRNLRTYDR